MDTLLDSGGFFESPRWHRGRWWVSDFFRRTVVTVDLDGTAREVLTVEGQPSGLGWMPDGSMLVVSMLEHRILRFNDGKLSLHADVSDLCGGNLNDLVVNASGHAYASNFGFDIEQGADPRSTHLIGVAPDGTATAYGDGLVFPNGMVIDRGTLIVGETGAARYTAFTVAADGALTDQRVWAQIGVSPRLTTLAETTAQLTFAPDGCTLDAEGHLWGADALYKRCVRVAPGGAIVAELPIPDGLDALACMLGGDDGRTLLICATPESLTTEHDRRDSILFTTTVDVPHAGLP